MYLYENILQALAGLKSNKLRSVLTMLGIIIGIAAVIIIMTIGRALNGSVIGSFAGIGGNSVFAAVQEKDSPSSRPDGSEESRIGESDRISMEMIQSLMNRFQKEIQSYAIQQNAGIGKIKDGRRYANIDFLGVNETFNDSTSVELLKGRFFREADIQSSRNVAIISDDAAKKIFKGTKDPLGQTIKVYNNTGIYTYTIIGVYKPQSQGLSFGAAASDADKKTTLYIPITVANRQKENVKNGYLTVTFAAKPGINPVDIRFDIEKFMNRYYEKNPYFKINTFSTEEILKILSSILGSLSAAIALIASISLLVGGIGVMNIMLVSVTERTRDIGTRKAIGAKKNAIRLQFTIEAVILCLIGGFIGIVFGLVIGYVGSSIIGYPSLPSIQSVAIAVGFSMLIGVFFGYYPANKAASLNPIDALRYE